MNNNIEKSLEKILTKQESAIYLYLLENPGQTVYYIAKALGLSRSSAYPTVDAMYTKGILLKLSTDTQAYYPENPETLIKKLRVDYNNTFDELQEVLKDIKPNEATNFFMNINSFEANLEKAKELLLKVKEEVYLNCDASLDIFDKEFAILEERGVRIITFSFSKQESKYKNVEIYSYGYPQNILPTRIMIVSDMKEVLVASSINQNNEWIGTITNNNLMIRIMSEHIHHDIYLYKIQKKYKALTGENLFVKGKDDLFLNTLNENESFFCKDKENK
ncbi:MAG: helix-turn-helix domain-containing protein [Bacilli bacterium]|nr:helix-turn-helix domain-containing protein [Bacilli bacterium]